MRFGAVICAAGGGTRMGQNKALCRLSANETFLSSIVSSIRRVDRVAPIAVVVGAQAERVIDAHKDLDVSWIENRNWETTHMLDSLMLGISAIEPGHDILHWPVDCIGILPSDIEMLLHVPTASLAVLSFRGVPGHPLRLSASKADWLRQHAAEFSSLKEVIHSDARVFVESQTYALMNCNTPEMLADFLAHRKDEKFSK